MELVPQNIHEIPGHSAKETFRGIVKPLQTKKEELGTLDNFVVQTRKLLSHLDRYVGAEPEVAQAFSEYAKVKEGKRELQDLPENIEASERVKILSTNAVISLRNNEIDRLDAKREENRKIIEAYLRKQHQNYFGVLDNLSFREKKEEDLIDPKQQAIDQIIELSAGYLRKRSGLPTVSINQEQETVRQFVETVVESTSDFDSMKMDLNRKVDLRNLTSKEAKLLPIQQLIAYEKNQIQAEIEIACLDPEVRSFATRDWIRERIAEKIKGIKIVPARFYERIIEFAKAIGDKENGIGGRLYYGPPGTGKTELAIEINRQEGYKSRVISMHYWTSFSQLFGEAMIQIGKDKALSLASHADRVSAVLNYLSVFGEGNEAGEKFYKIANPVGLISGNLNSEEKNQALLDCKDKLGQRLLLIGEGIIPEAAGEDAMSWVEGEIPLAIRNNERVVLDEIDKAGPGSLDSLSRFLAMSPESKTPLKIRDFEINPPVWFRIDATANTMDLNEPTKQFLYDRFNHVFVEYPPPKDEMLVALSWIADEDGNIPLDEYRQNQFVMFFTFLLPELRKLYRENKLSQPISLRSVKDFCSLIVNPTTHEDRGMAFDEAIDQLFLRQRQFAANETERNTLQDVIRGYRSVFRQPVAMDEFGSQIQKVESSTDTLKKQRIKAIREGISQVIESPLINAINTLPENLGSSDGKSGLEKDKTIISSASTVKIDINVEEIGLRRGSRKLFDISSRRLEDLSIFEWIHGDVKILRTDFKDNDNMSGIKYLDSSIDGKTILATDESEKKCVVYALVAGKLTPMISHDTDLENESSSMTPDGKRFLIFSSKGQKIEFINIAKDEKEVHKFNFKIDEYQQSQISQDGRFILLQDRSGYTYLFDFQKIENLEYITPGDAVKKYKAKNLNFVGNRLINQEGTNQIEMVID